MVFEICFLPWVDRPFVLKFGPVQIQPFGEEFKQTLQDDVAKYLDDYFAQYVDYQGESVSNLSVCTYGDKGVAPLIDEQRKKIRRAVDALIFNAISRTVRNSVEINNRSWGPPTSDVFELFFQNFDPQEDHIFVTAGSTAHCWGKGDITFPKPLSLGGSMWGYEEEMLKALSKCLSAGSGKFRERVFKSLEWFRLAHTEQSQTSIFSKVVMMGTAFEILLDFPRNGKTKHFVGNVHSILDSEEFRQGTRTTFNGKKFRNNLAGLWAGKFYDLRSRIVHGNRVSARDVKYTNRHQERDMKWVTHLIVADIVFYDVMANFLFENRCFGEKSREMAQDLGKLDGSPPSEHEGFCFKLLYGSKTVHKRLGWLKKKFSE